MMRIILGSQSPRRKELLAHIIKDFEIPLAPIKEEAPKIEKTKIGLPTIKRAYI